MLPRPQNAAIGATLLLKFPPPAKGALRPLGHFPVQAGS